MRENPRTGRPAGFIQTQEPVPSLLTQLLIAFGFVGGAATRRT